MKHMSFLAVFTLSVLSATWASAARHERGERQMFGHAGLEIGHGRMMARLADHLGLSEEQKIKIKAMRKASLPEIKKIRGQIKQTTYKVRESFPGDPNYTAIIGEDSKRIGELTGQLILQSAHLRSDVWQALNPEQRLKLESLQANRHNRAQNRRMDDRRGESHHRRYEKAN